MDSKKQSCPVCVVSVSAAQVLVRGRLYTVRGKGKSAFLMLRQRTATVQVRGPLRPEWRAW